MHDDFHDVYDSSEANKKRVEDISIMDKDPIVARMLINSKHLTHEQCVDHQTHRIQKTWRVGLVYLLAL